MKAVLRAGLIALAGFCVAPVWAKTPAADWVSHNRSISLGAGVLQQRYTETDAYGYTTDGVLNSERGKLRSFDLVARWQGALSTKPTIPSLWLHGRLRHSTGNTDYQGYLQSGSTLIPYASTTGNALVSGELRVGAAFANSDVAVQSVPYIAVQRQTWRRELTQYTEDFSHTAALAGLLVQWRIAPAWSAELDAAAGRMLAAHMRSADLGFDQKLGTRPVWQLGAQIGYQVTPQWRASLYTDFQHYRYGASAVQNGMQEPASLTQQLSYGARLSWCY